MPVDAINPSTFHPINVTDTCAVWNVLSSDCLYQAAVAAGCDFCLTDFVQYECVFKRRGALKPTDQALMDRLKKEQSKGRFRSHPSTIADLQRVAQLEQRRRLGLGELSSLAFAMQINQALLTDDQKARMLAQEVGHPLIQTTPHLFGWLVYSGRLAHGDRKTVVQEHSAMGQILGRHFEDAYTLAQTALQMSALQAPSLPAADSETD